MRTSSGWHLPKSHRILDKLIPHIPMLRPLTDQKNKPTWKRCGSPENVHQNSDWLIMALIPVFSKYGGAKNQKTLPQHHTYEVFNILSYWLVLIEIWSILLRSPGSYPWNVAWARSFSFICHKPPPKKEVKFFQVSRIACMITCHIDSRNVMSSCDGMSVKQTKTRKKQQQTGNQRN